MAVIQIISGTGGYLSEGTSTSRTTTPALPAGGLAVYYSTDNGQTSLYDLSTTSWVTIAGGGTTAGGSNHQVQYNNAGTLGGLTLTNGQLLIGSTGANPATTTLTAGAGIGIANAAGGITLSNAGVTALVAGTGISLSSTTGSVTVSQTTPGGGTNWSAKTTTYAVTSGDNGTDFTNTGAGTTITFNLPSGLTNVVYGFLADTTQTIIIAAATTNTLMLAGALSASGGTATTSVMGSYVRFSSYKAGAWDIFFSLFSWGWPLGPGAVSARQRSSARCRRLPAPPQIGFIRWRTPASSDARSRPRPISATVQAWPGWRRRTKRFPVGPM